MADGSMAPSISLRGKVSEEEWQARVDLAALYRLVALYGWDDMIYTHISARVPGPDHHFLINPYGLFFGRSRRRPWSRSIFRGRSSRTRPISSIRPGSPSTRRSTRRGTTRIT